MLAAAAVGAVAVEELPVPGLAVPGPAVRGAVRVLGCVVLAVADGGIGP